VAIKPERILKELRRRTAEAEKASAVPLFTKEKYCFDKQLAFVNEKSIIKTALTSRRAGKTNAIVADFIDTCLNERDVVCLYTTLTFRSARNIIWNDLKKVCQDFELNVKVDEQRLNIYFHDTRSEIRCGGAKDESEIEKYRGWKLRKAYIDEVQSFRPYIAFFVNDILLPGLRDLNGELGLTGTPGPVPAGVFYEYCNSDHIPNHHWTAFDNPHMHNPPIKDLNLRLSDERRLKGITEADPGYQRETYGKWVEDTNSLVFKFNKMLNVFGSPPVGRMIYIMGVDIGWNDSDAIAVIGYNYQDGSVYLVEEDIQDKQTITELVKKIDLFKTKYGPVKIIMDAGALGKKIQEEIKQRHGLNIEAAEKHRKHEFIELMNDDLRTGRMRCFQGSRFEQDTSLVVWDRSDPIKPTISTVYHTDIGDAVLYAWRECKHYISQEGSVKEPNRNTNEYMELLEAKEAQALLDKQDPEYMEDTDVVSNDDMEYIFDSSGSYEDY
jgi:hypothetical protein